MNHPLVDLLRQAAEKVTGLDSPPDSISRVELTVAGYHPSPSYQVNVKPKDATLAWGTSVSGDPVEAMVQALDIFLRGEEARKTESTAVHHPTKEGAKALAEVVEMEYGDQIAATKIELIPYKGWVVVVFPKTGQDLSELLPRVELRELPLGKPKTPAGGGRATSASPLLAAPYGKPVGPAPEGGRASLTKDKLEAEYKAIFGKGPDRNIKKLDLAKMLDDLEAQSSGSTPTAPQEAEEEEDGADLL